MDTDVGLTVGALLLGTLITAVGYGITTTQTYMYRSRFPQDPWFIRWTVWTLLALDTIHIAFSWHLVYHYVVLNFGNHAALERVAWSFSATIVITAIITTIVHCFYARRILILGNRRRLVPALILVLSVVRLALGFLACAQIITLKTFQRVQHDTLATVVVGLGSGTLADCVITTTLVYLLRTHKSQISPGYVDELLTGRNTAVRTPKPDIALASYVGSLNSTLDRIVYWTVNNGVLTSVVGVAFLVTQFSHMPANMVFIALHLLLSKLYANSLLATLNSREAHDNGHGVDTAEEQISTMSLRNILRGRPRNAVSAQSSTGVVSSVIHIRGPSVPQLEPGVGMGVVVGWADESGADMWKPGRGLPPLSPAERAYCV